MRSKILLSVILLTLSCSLSFAHDKYKKARPCDCYRVDGPALNILTGTKTKIEKMIRREAVDVVNGARDVACEQAALLFHYNLAFDHFEELKLRIIQNLPTAASKEDFISSISDKYHSDDADKIIFTKQENNEGDMVVALSPRVVAELSNIWEVYQVDNDYVMIALNTECDMHFRLESFYVLTGFDADNITARPDFSRE